MSLLDHTIISCCFLFFLETPPPAYSQGGSPPDGAMLQQGAIAQTPTGNDNSLLLNEHLWPNISE